jgi:hypothetical protein
MIILINKGEDGTLQGLILLVKQVKKVHYSAQFECTVAQEKMQIFHNLAHILLFHLYQWFTARCVSEQLLSSSQYFPHIDI